MSIWPQDNPSSWEDVLKSIAERPDDHNWLGYKGDMRSIMEAGINSNLNKSFRAGLSMSYILFSTLPHHRLQSEPHVILERSENGGEFFVGYSGASIRDTARGAGEAFALLRSHLKRLWDHTKPGEPLPPGLLSLD